MNFRIDPRDELSRERFVGRFTSLLAKCEIIVDRCAELSLRVRNRSALKGDDIANAQDLAMKQIGIGVIFGAAEIVLIRSENAGTFNLHSVTPA